MQNLPDPGHGVYAGRLWTLRYRQYQRYCQPRHGAGPDASFAPEMEAFARIYGVHFWAHRINDANRKARIERPFDYVERNFLAGRTFSGWHDLNLQARIWCDQVANYKPKRSLGMSPMEAWLMEKPSLQPFPL
jgi:hypothetical protein